MADMLNTGLDWLADKLKAHVSRSVTYKRGVDEVTVSATIGRTLLKLQDDYGGIRMVWTDRDFLIQAADMVLAAVTVLPERGDKIVEVVGSNNVTFEVMAPGGEPHWRWSDPYHKLLRIHTKRIKTEAV